MPNTTSDFSPRISSTQNYITALRLGTSQEAVNSKDQLHENEAEEINDNDVDENEEQEINDKEVRKP